MSAASPLLPVEEALSRVLALMAPLPVEDVALTEAVGRVLARPLAAAADQPPFAASAMDGYALRAADAAAGACLPVRGEIAAGEMPDAPLPPGAAMRIFTGAPIPEGADCVVIQEDVTREGDTLRLSGPAQTGANIRPAGGDFRKGQPFPAPRRLGPADVALLAAMNQPRLPVHRRPDVAIIATGDELVMPGTRPGPGQIVASGSFGLHAMITAAGGRARLLPIAPDDAEGLAFTLELAREADLIVTIGGASVGAHDLVARVAASLGMEPVFHRIALRPGKPLMAGRLFGRPVLGLPGNPVSAMVCGMLFVLPALEALQGLPAVLPVPRPARLSRPLGPNGPRTHYMRAHLSAGGDLPAIAPAPSQDSAMLSVLAEASALLVRPAGEGAREAGEIVGYLPLPGRA